MQNVTVGMVAPAFIYFPVWVAQQRGFFQARDIACSIAVAGTTDGVTNGLASGDTQFAMVTPEGVVGDALKGGPLRLVAGNANKAPLSLIGQKGLTAVEDLHGKRVGTTSLKEGTAVILQKILGVHGLHYLGDYEFAMVGAHPQRWEKLQQGEIEAGLQLLPYNYLAEDAGIQTSVKPPSTSPTMPSRRSRSTRHGRSQTGRSRQPSFRRCRRRSPGPKRTLTRARRFWPKQATRRRSTPHGALKSCSPAAPRHATFASRGRRWRRCSTSCAR